MQLGVIQQTCLHLEPRCCTLDVSGVKPQTLVYVSVYNIQKYFSDVQISFPLSKDAFMKATDY